MPLLTIFTSTDSNGRCHLNIVVTGGASIVLSDWDWYRNHSNARGNADNTLKGLSIILDNS